MREHRAGWPALPRWPVAGLLTVMVGCEEQAGGFGAGVGSAIALLLLLVVVLPALVAGLIALVVVGLRRRRQQGPPPPGS